MSVIEGLSARGRVRYGRFHCIAVCTFCQICSYSSIKSAIGCWCRSQHADCVEIEGCSHQSYLTVHHINIHSVIDAYGIVDQPLGISFQELGHYITHVYFTAKNDLLFWQLHLSPELRLWRGFKGWCKVTAINGQCGQCSPCWVQQQLKFCPQYRDPSHCKIWLATLTTLWLPYVYFGIRDRLHKTSARQLVQTSSLTILGTSTKSSQLSRHGNFHTLMATGDSLTDVQ